MMYMYRTSDYVAEDIENMNLMPSPAAELIVPAKTSITVDNLYKYSKIEIQGKVADGTSGKLTVIGPRGIREFDSDTFFITKSMVANFLFRRSRMIGVTTTESATKNGSAASEINVSFGL